MRARSCSTQRAERPAAQLARLVGNVQLVTPFDGITRRRQGPKLVVILGT
jgi:hypothetical protein